MLDPWNASLRRSMIGVPFGDECTEAPGSLIAGAWTAVTYEAFSPAARLASRRSVDMDGVFGLPSSTEGAFAGGMQPMPMADDNPPFGAGYCCSESVDAPPTSMR